VNVENLTEKEKLVFFVNMFNALCLQSHVDNGIPAPAGKHGLYELYKKASIRVGSKLTCYTLFDIEYLVLRSQMTKPDIWG